MGRVRDMGSSEKRIIDVFDANKIFDDKVKKLDPQNQVIKKRTNNLNFDFEIKCNGDEEEKILRADIDRRCGEVKKKLKTDIEKSLDEWWKNHVVVNGKIVTIVNASDVDSALGNLGDDLKSLLKAQADEIDKQIKKILRSRKRGKLHKASMAVKSVRLAANPVLRVAGGVVAAILTAPTIILPILIIAKTIGGVGKDVKSAAVFYSGERRSTEKLQDSIVAVRTKLQKEYDDVINETDAKVRAAKNTERGNREVWAKIHTDFLSSEKDSIKRLEYYLDKYKQKIDLHRARMLKHARILDKLAKEAGSLDAKKAEAERKLAAQNNFNPMKSNKKVKALNEKLVKIAAKKKELTTAVATSKASMDEYSGKLDTEEATIADCKASVAEFKSTLPKDVKKAKRLLNGIGAVFSAGDFAIDTASGQFGPDMTATLTALDNLTQVTGTLEAVADEAVSQFGDRVATKLAKR